MSPNVLASYPRTTGVWTPGNELPPRAPGAQRLSTLPDEGPPQYGRPTLSFLRDSRSEIR